MLFKKFLFAAVFSALLLFSMAAAQEIKYQSAPGTDFSKYKTYKWGRAEKARYPDEMSDKILMRTIDEQLSLKGLTKTEDDSADLYVVYQLAITEDFRWNSFRVDKEWQGAGANINPGFRGATTTTTETVRVGWMILDLYDIEQKKVVWQANATKTLGNSTDPKKMEKNARKAMTKIFKNYPPKTN